MTPAADGIDAVVVAVPAKDEADRVSACLASISTALDHPALAKATTFVVVAADGCTDGTEERVAAHRVADPRTLVVRGRWHAAGAARAAATAHGLLRAAAAPHRTWIATTDADSTVPPDWLAEQFRLAADGWAAVAGVVRLGADASAATRAAFTRSYELPRRGGHHPHVHGANLGLRGDAYAAVGGWSSLALAEDHAIWHRLMDEGYPVISSTSSWVVTSGRLEGRAGGGFADTLAGLIA